jgi:hypothetical protein
MIINDNKKNRRRRGWGRANEVPSSTPYRSDNASYRACRPRLGFINLSVWAHLEAIPSLKYSQSGCQDILRNFKRYPRQTITSSNTENLHLSTDCLPSRLSVYGTNGELQRIDHHRWWLVVSSHLDFWYISRSTDVVWRMIRWNWNLSVRYTFVLAINLLQNIEAKKVLEEERQNMSMSKSNHSEQQRPERGGRLFDRRINMLTTSVNETLVSYLPQQRSLNSLIDNIRHRPVRRMLMFHIHPREFSLVLRKKKQSHFGPFSDVDVDLRWWKCKRVTTRCSSARSTRRRARSRSE